MANWYVRFEDVEYVPGAITAIGYIGQKEALRTTIHTSGAPHGLAMDILNEQPLKPGGVAIVKVKVTDANGNVVPTADALIDYEVKDGSIIGCGNGDPGDHASDHLPVRHAFHGLAEVLIRLPSHEGEAILRAEAEGLMSCVIRLEATDSRASQDDRFTPLLNN